jgi:hypothetical protein
MSGTSTKIISILFIFQSILNIIVYFTMSEKYIMIQMTDNNVGHSDIIINLFEIVLLGLAQLGCATFLLTTKFYFEGCTLGIYAITNLGYHDKIINIFQENKNVYFASAETVKDYYKIMISENYNRMIEKEDTDKKGENNE